MLHIKNLSVNIDDDNILKNLSLNVQKGDVHAIMGPNGSGKSTLAKVVSGHPGYQITNGSIEFKTSNKTKDILQMDVDMRAKSGIFTAFQYPISISNLTNFKFLYSFFNSHCAHQGIDNMNEEAFKKYVISLLPKVKIDKEFLERDVNDGFSGGERKKNEILQMLLIKPKLVILDEIDSGLDIDSLKVISNCINEYRSNNNAIVMITHYQRILNYVKPNYVHIIHDGKIVKTGDIKLSYQVEEQGYKSIVQLKEN